MVLIILWVVAGIVLGWLIPELFAMVTDRAAPYFFNFGMAYVGGLSGYTFGIWLLHSVTAFA